MPLCAGYKYFVFHIFSISSFSRWLLNKEVKFYVASCDGGETSYWWAGTLLSFEVSLARLLKFMVVKYWQKSQVVWPFIPLLPQLNLGFDSVMDLPMARMKLPFSAFISGASSSSYHFYFDMIGPILVFHEAISFLSINKEVELKLFSISLSTLLLKTNHCFSILTWGWNLKNVYGGEWFRI